MTSFRNAGIDLLRIIAIFTVVAIHSPSTDIAFRNDILRYLPPANACFALLAGWYLFGFSRELLSVVDVGHILHKRLSRLIIPYIVWESLYVVMNIVFDLMTGKVNLPSWMGWAEIVFFGSGSVQLWFVVTLLYVQIVLCGVMILANKLFARSGMIWIASCFLMLGCSFLCWKHFGISNNYLRRFVFLFGYGALGVGIRYVTQDVNPGRLISLCGMILGLFGVAFSYAWDVPEIVSVFSWCLAFSCLPIRSGLLQKYTLSGAGTVMGIYLCHTLFTRLLSFSVPKLSACITNGHVMVLINAVVAMAASFLFVLCLRRSRMARYIGM